MLPITHNPLFVGCLLSDNYSRTPLIRTLVIRIGLTFRVNLSIIPYNYLSFKLQVKYNRVLWLLELQIKRGRHF